MKKANKTIKPKKKKKIKIKFRFLFVFLLLIYLIIMLIINIINTPIKNIYIQNNDYLKDQTIIELAGLSDYPSTIKNTKSMIKKRLLKNIYIKDAKITKKGLTKIYINIIENRPLFYNSSEQKTVLLNHKTTKDKHNVPILINYIPDIIYSTFIDEIGKIDQSVLNKISEIKYEPDEVDDSLFVLTMSDANYVYLTLNKFNLINNYIDIVKQFNNKKGILYLNAGGYFKIIESKNN